MLFCFQILGNFPSMFFMIRILLNLLKLGFDLEYGLSGPCTLEKYMYSAATGDSVLSCQLSQVG